jgi:cysteine desulfurase/selenocysteine lyase
MPTFLVGGGMIDEVTRDSFTTAEAPDKFEAGTPNIEGAIGLGEACRYLTQITWPVITKRESELSKYFTQALAPLDFVKLLGTSTNRLPLFAMSFTDMHPHDVADLLGERGIITRAGQHCAAPLHDQLKLRATLRASLAFYNTEAEIDTFIIALKEIHQLLNS